MRKTVKNEQINIKKESAKKYLLKYIKELEIHFDLNEEEIKDIILQTFYSKCGLYKAVKKIRKLFLKCWN